jgi:CDGSH-type Zn-finger protein/truncated hemoglobin YjbI
MTDLEQRLRALLAAVTELQSVLQHETSDEPTDVIGTRLHDSVVRPLRQALPVTGTDDGAAVSGDPQPSDEPAHGNVTPPGSNRQVSDLAWELAEAATELRVRHPDSAEIAEATAALQDLAITLANESSAASLLGELATLQSELEPQIQVARNGPYLVTNAGDFYDWLGQPLPVRPQMALCRCGASQIKPFCDGTHAGIGFTDPKDPDRVPDWRHTYVGQQVTILDNRGACQHSGLCTDRLATVFRLREEPFVTPSGGRMDEIIRAVRDCPSGALSYAIDGVEARADVDHHGQRDPTIEVSKDGPYRVVGGMPLVDPNGADMARNEGSSREHYALCRCGHSQNKPFCSGMHWYVEFQDPVPAEDHEPTIFEWAGGLPALTRMTRLFYEKHVPQDPLLAPRFATMSADHPERVAKWLGEVFCGPKAYSAEYGGYPRMISQHLGKSLTEEQRTRWVSLLMQSAREAGLPNDAEFRSALGAYIEWGSRLAVENSQTGAKPPEHMPMPHWDWHTAAGPPGSRISALAPPPEEDAPDVVLPAADEPVSFEHHLKPLFRATDKRSMSFAFDLWSYSDVSQHAGAILDRLRAGTMPCDGAWPEANVDVFQRWVESGKAP